METTPGQQDAGQPPSIPGLAPAHDHASAGAADALRLWQRFHIRLSGVYGGLVVVVVALMAGAFYLRGVRSEIDSLKERLRAVAVSLSREVTAEDVEVLVGPEDSVRPEYAHLVSLFERIGAGEPDLVSMYVLKPTDQKQTLRFAVDWQREGAEAAQVGDEYDATDVPKLVEGLERPSFDDAPVEDEWGITISGYAPVRDAAGRAVGLVGVDVSAASVDQMKRDVRALTLLVFLAAALGLGLMAWIVGRNVQEPLGRIIEATSAIAGGRLEVRAGMDRLDEFGILGKHFDQMASGLREREFIRSTFGRYVSEDVARRILASREGGALGGEEREVTALLSDLAGYSSISELLPPAEVVRMLNAYLEAMGELIDRRQGCVIEFLGDAILCVFGAPGDQPDHAERAVRCAMEMRVRLAELNREWEASGLAKLWRSQGVPELRARIGLHTGRVVAGNLGSRSRVKYAVIGDAVNVASQAEQLNKVTRTDLLLTATTLSRLPEELRAQAVDQGEHAIRGTAEPVRLWTIPNEPPAA